MDYHYKEGSDHNLSILDTNFVYALLDRNDSNNEQAYELLKSQTDSTKFIIPIIVIAELLASKIDFDVIWNYCKDLSNNFEQSTISDIQLLNKIPHTKRKSLKANDCLIWAMSKRVGAKVLTFDKKFQNLINSNG